MGARPNQAQWLAQVVEPVLEPELAICDPHHHLWDRPEERYLIPEMVADFSGHRVTSTVFVECIPVISTLDGKPFAQQAKPDG